MNGMQAIKFCSRCGENVSVLTPDGDTRNRHVCDVCGQIHYLNPKVVCGCIPVWDGRILLCKRAIEPRMGLWTLPAGFMENGETVQHGAARETMEEACAPVTKQRLFGVYNLPRANQVYVMFLAELTGADNFAAGEESLEARLFDESEIPWDKIAFRVIHQTLKRYFQERKNGKFSIAVEDVL